MKKNIVSLVLTFFIISTSFAVANSSPGKVHGIVRSSDGKPIEFVTVFVKNSKYSTMTNEQGKYKLDVPKNKCQLVFSHVNYEPVEMMIELKEYPATKKQDVVLKENSKTLQEVEVIGKSAAQHVRETAYNVATLDAKALYNSTADLTDALSKISGIKVRESGGLGSDYSVYLNGFTGRHVKFFMDGVPMDGFGASFQLNNIPINLAEYIEVYKGVVPITFGADALGGAINIVTKKRTNFVEASYSYGSFNTHKTFINAGYTAKNGFTIQLNAFQNYSDNNYNVDVRLVDAAGNFEDHTTRVKRFNDTYHTETVITNIGFVDKPFADRLLLGINLGKNYADIQNANNMNFVYGEKFRHGNTIMPTLRYEKKNFLVSNLDATVNANFNFGYTQNVDTAVNRKYTWLGTYYERNQKGELAYTLYKYNNNDGSATAGFTYKLNDKHVFALNDVFTTFYRIGFDELASNNDDQYPSVSRKNVLGLGYNLLLKNWRSNIFYKHYYQYSEGYLLSGTDYIKQTNNYTSNGYGLASSYFLGKYLQFKVSYENTLRLPTGREIFGDGDLEGENFDIKPESSDNYNLGVTFTSDIRNAHQFYIDASLAYRDVKDYIRRQISESKGVAVSENIGGVSNIGGSLELNYAYKKVFSLGGNITYQNIRSHDKTKVYNNDRVPNNPYFFWNADFNLSLNELLKNTPLGGYILLEKGNSLNFGYHSTYVYSFYLKWPSIGTDKSLVPTQLSHDINLTYTIKNGRYNISLECNNLTDTKLYDNYSLQKPGRAFQAKFRYFLNFKK